MADLADRIREVLAAQLIEFTGECACDEAYTSRTLIDPQCVWHAAGGNEFSEDAAEAVAAALTVGGDVEWGIRRVGGTTVLPQTEQRARFLTEGPGLEGYPDEVVSRVVGPWEVS